MQFACSEYIGFCIAKGIFSPYICCSFFTIQPTCFETYLAVSNIRSAIECVEIVCFIFSCTFSLTLNQAFSCCSVQVWFEELWKFNCVLVLHLIFLWKCLYALFLSLVVASRRDRNRKIEAPAQSLCNIVYCFLLTSFAVATHFFLRFVCSSFFRYLVYYFFESY